MRSKKAIEEAREQLNNSEAFFYADEFNVSWQPTLRAMWSPVGQQVMVRTPGKPAKHYGIGATHPFHHYWRKGCITFGVALK